MIIHGLGPLPIPRPLFEPEGPPAGSAPPAGDTPPAGSPPPADGTPPAPAAPPPGGTPPATALENKPPAGVTPDFGDNWRELLATGADGKVDPKELERLQRFSRPSDLYASYKSAEARITAGRGKDVPMPDAATDPDGNKRWREERGVPVEVTGYTVPDDLTARMLPTDKPVLANFTEFAHKKGLPASFVQAGSEWYVDLLEQQAEVRNTADTTAAQNTEKELVKAWGNDFTVNRQAAKMYSDEAIPGVSWFDARLPDDPKYGEFSGRKLGDIPAVSMALAKFARMEFGDTAFIGGAQTKVTETRMTELKTIMQTDFDRWQREPALRAEYYKLLEADSKRPGNQQRPIS